MLSSIFTSNSGLLAFSKELDVVSNNVSNLNTVGYKGNDAVFKDLFYREQVGSNHGDGGLESDLGTGSDLAGTQIRFRAGEMRATGNSTDLAIDGNGFFIVKDDAGKLFYTRAGRFSFDDDHRLVEPTRGAVVMALDGSGNLREFSLASNQVDAAKATSEVKFSKTMSVDDTEHVISGIKLIDADGKTHECKLTLKKSDTEALTWNLTVENEKSESIGAGKLAFNASYVTAETKRFVFDLKAASGSISHVTFNFGEPPATVGGVGSGVTALSAADSDMAVDSVDGHAKGTLLKLSFSDAGLVELEYSNGQKNKGQQVALAWFGDLQSLQREGDNLFTAPEDASPLLSHPTEQGLGKILGGQLELSNIELAQEFTDIILAQRGYQASSQILNISSEMIQDLYKVVEGR